MVLSTVPCCGCVGQKFTCLFSIEFFQKCTNYTAYISIIFYERIFNLHKHSNSIRAYYYQTFIKLSNQYLLIAIFEYSLLELFKATQYPSSNRVLNRNWNTYQLKWIHIRLCLRSRHRQNILFIFQNGKKPNISDIWHKNCSNSHHCSRRRGLRILLHLHSHCSRLRRLFAIRERC